MNVALEKRDSLEDRWNYVVKSQPERGGGRMQYDFQLYPGKLGKLKRRSDGQFHIVAIGDATSASDFWGIPYKAVSTVLTETNLTHDGRWRFHIEGGSFVIYPGQGQRAEVRVQEYYSVLPPV